MDSVFEYLINMAERTNAASANCKFETRDGGTILLTYIAPKK